MRPTNVKTIAKREYLARIRSKGFWISTLALPVLMAAWAVLPALMIAKTKARLHLAVVDVTGEVAEPLAVKLEEWAERTADQVKFELEILEPEGDTEAQRAELDRRVLEDDIAAWVWIDEELLEQDLAEYHSESVANFITQEALAGALSTVIREVRLEGAGYDVEAIAELSRSIDLQTVRVSEEGSHAEAGFGGFALAFGLFMILYITTLIYGQQVMLGVLEEKSTRVVEVVLSAASPVELMSGKLIGICLIGLTQLGIWLGTGAILTAPAVVASMAWMPEGVTLPAITLPLVIHFLLLFLLGYFIYATYYAMIGSAFNNPQEAQQLGGVMVIFVVFPWIFFLPVLNDPDSTLAVVTSLIPIFTPFIMMLRIAVKTPPAWQIALGYLLTLGMCVVMVWLCARVYRVGILMYGKKPTFAELWRWLRYA